MSVLGTVKSYFCLKNGIKIRHTNTHTHTPGHLAMLNLLLILSVQGTIKLREHVYIITEYKRNHSTNVDHLFGWIFFHK